VVAVNETPEQRDDRLQRFLDEVRNAYVMWLYGWRNSWPEEQAMADQIHTQLARVTSHDLGRLVVLLLQEHESETLQRRALEWQRQLDRVPTVGDVAA
jgi:hypothetical protein